jgi:hypothetical protein
MFVEAIVGSRSPVLQEYVRIIRIASMAVGGGYTAPLSFGGDGRGPSQLHRASSRVIAVDARWSMRVGTALLSAVLGPDIRYVQLPRLLLFVTLEGNVVLAVSGSSGETTPTRRWMWG